MSLGLAYTSFAVRMLQGRDIMQSTAAALPAAAFVDLCIQAGAGGCQIDLSQLDGLDAEALAALRDTLERHALFVELSVPAESLRSEEAFAAMAATAHALGVNCVRTALLMGRRYESFPTGDDWRAFHDGWASRLSQAARFAERAQGRFDGEGGFADRVESFFQHVAREERAQQASCDLRQRRIAIEVRWRERRQGLRHVQAAIRCEAGGDGVADRDRWRDAARADHLHATTVAAGPATGRSRISIWRSHSAPKPS